MCQLHKLKVIINLLFKERSYFIGIGHFVSNGGRLFQNGDFSSLMLPTAQTELFVVPNFRKLTLEQL